ncbi:hypothetical protein [Streptomyces sp. NPDC046727]|uniref:hypothetical protein n=1 Tax=Streptomyces sp. NPDC046727 TaxID=3155373 RepID=UPI00340390B8
MELFFERLYVAERALQFVAELLARLGERMDALHQGRSSACLVELAAHVCRECLDLAEFRMERLLIRMTGVRPRRDQVRAVGGVIERLSQDFREG